MDMKPKVERFRLRNIVKIVILILLLTGAFFISLNFASPHTAPIRSSYQTDTPNINYPNPVASVNNTYLNGNYYYPPFQPPNTDFLNLPPISLHAGQGIEAKWDTDIYVTGFIFSEQQFNNFKSVVIQLNNNSFDFSAWASKNGTNFEASNVARKNGAVAFRATESGNYYAAIFLHGGFVQVFDFKEYLVTYTAQMEKDNLYLYIGVAFLIAAAIITVTLISQLKNLKVSKIISKLLSILNTNLLNALTSSPK